jgi:hypothetical protein
MVDYPENSVYWRTSLLGPSRSGHVSLGFAEALQVCGIAIDPFWVTPACICFASVRYKPGKKSEFVDGDFDG